MDTDSSEAAPWEFPPNVQPSSDQALRDTMIFSGFQTTSTERLPKSEAARDRSSPRTSRVGRAGPLALAVSLLFLAACSTRSELHFTTLANQVPVTKAIVVPPPGGPAVVAVLENRFLNGVSQEIALSTAAQGIGQNTIWISLMNDPDALTEIDDVLRIRPITQERIQSEMEDRLPGIDMRTSTYYVQNKYGPFGYATGYSSARDLCFYAWQRIEPTENAIFSTSGLVSIRVRLCEAGATEEQLLRVMYGYTISAFFGDRGWNPYGTPPPPAPQLGQIDAPMYPTGAGIVPLNTTPTPPAPAQVARPRPSTPRSRPAPAAADEAPATQPAADERLTGFPVVPLPPP